MHDAKATTSLFRTLDDVIENQKWRIVKERSDPDFLFVFFSNFLSSLNGSRDIGMCLYSGSDVICF